MTVVSGDIRTNPICTIFHKIKVLVIWNHPQKLSRIIKIRGYMSTIAFDQFAHPYRRFRALAVAPAPGPAPPARRRRRISTRNQCGLHVGVGLHHGMISATSCFQAKTTPFSRAGRGAGANFCRRARLRSRLRSGHADRLVGLLPDDPGRKARLADAGKPRRGACGDRGKISVGAQRDRRHRRAVTFFAPAWSAGAQGAGGHEPDIACSTFRFPGRRQAQDLCRP